MSVVHIALVQMRCEKGDIAGNLEEMRRTVAEAAGRGVDIICFPEMSLTGYVNPSRQPHAVLRLDGPEAARFAALTAGNDLTAVAGIVEANPGEKPFITQVVAQGGSIAGWYRKATIPEDEAPWFAAGAGMPVPVFAHRGVPFSIAVCADIDNPAVFAAAARQGARIVFEAAAPGLYGSQETRDWQSGFDWWRSECHAKLGRYARDNRIAIAVATQAGRTVDEDFPGGGYVFAPDGGCIAATPDWSEGVLYAELSIDAP